MVSKTIKYLSCFVALWCIQFHQASYAAPVSGMPSSVELATAVGGLDLNVGKAMEMGESRTLTGPGDPVKLSIKHR